MVIRSNCPCQNTTIDKQTAYIIRRRKGAAISEFQTQRLPPCPNIISGNMRRSRRRTRIPKHNTYRRAPTRGVYNQRPDVVNPTAPSAASVYLRIFCFICSRATVLTRTCRRNAPRGSTSGARGLIPPQTKGRRRSELVQEHLGWRISKNSGTFRVFRTFL